MFMMMMMMKLCDIINIYITLPCRQPLVANLRALCLCVSWEQLVRLLT